MIPGKTLWQHSRRVTKLLWTHPSHGLCEMHSILDHVCVMYSCSEDRSLRVWSTTNYECIKEVDSKTLRSSSMLSMAQSGRHIFIGTTAAKVAVFTKHNSCERDDIHGCSLPAANKSFCLQITLKLPATNKMMSGNVPTVQSLLCTGENYEYSYLLAGDSTGQVTVWKNPSKGIDFASLMVITAHRGPVRALSSTWRHLFTVGDDGVLFLYSLATLKQVRMIDIMEWSNDKVKFLSVAMLINLA